MDEFKDQNTEHLLILCVDRDDDIGRKTGIKTPILGKKLNLESAVKLILADPEEADANAMFEAVRVYDNLKKDQISESDFEIATISGSEIGGVTADRKLVSELSEVLGKYRADELILVTDGFSDEDIMPLVQSRIPVTSVRRVVVKHSETIEETAAVFSRYWKMVMEDPKYSKIALGLPGVFLISMGTLAVLSIFIQFDLYTWIGIIGLIILGGYLFSKGFGFDRKMSMLLSRAYHISVSGLVTGFSSLAGILLVGLGFYQSWSYIDANYPISIQFPIEFGQFLEILPQILGWLIDKSITMVIVGMCISLVGRAIGHALDRDSKFWRTSALVIIGAWSWTIFHEISQIILYPAQQPETLIISLIVGIIIIVASGLSAHLLSKRYKEVFKSKTEGKKQKPEDETLENEISTNEN